MATNKLGIDPKKFKHVSSDDKKTMLRHIDGHELTIAHSALSPEMKSQLSSLSKIGKDNQTESQAQEAQDQKPRLAFGGAFAEEDAKRAQQYKIPPAHNPSTRLSKPDAPAPKPAPKPPPPVDPEDEGYTTYPNHAEHDANGGQVGRKMYAAPDALVANDDSAPVEQDVTQVPDKFIPETKVKEEVIPEVAPDVKAKRDIYNKLVSAGGSTNDTPMGSAFGRGLGGMDIEDQLDAQFGQKGEPPKSFDPNIWKQAETQHAQEQVQNKNQLMQAQNDVAEQNVARTAAGLPPLPTPNIPEGPQIPGSAENPPPGTAPQDALNPSGQAPKPDDYGTGSVEDEMRQGLNARIKGIGQKAQAVDLRAKAESEALVNSQKAKAIALAEYQKQYHQLSGEIDNVRQDIKDGHIDPNKFWTGDKDGNGSHSKIAAGIGMILAGFNPTNSPNAAINFLKYQMDQNMQAQQANLTSKHNLLRANLEQFRDLKDATDVTRLMQNDMMQNELAQAAAKAASPMAKAAALDAQGQLKMEAAPMFQQFAMRRAMMGLANNNGDPSSVEHMLGYMRVTNPEMAKEMESRYVPGVGLGSTPIPNEARSEIIAKQGLDAAARDLFAYSQKHTNLVPGTAEYNFGQAKALAFQQKVREGLLGTVFRESEKPLLENFVKSNPAGAFKMLTTQPQLKSIIDSNAMGLNTLKRGYGLPVKESQQQSQPEVKTMGGVKYQRVNGGWQKL